MWKSLPWYSLYPSNEAPRTTSRPYSKLHWTVSSPLDSMPRRTLGVKVFPQIALVISIRHISQEALFCHQIRRRPLIKSRDSHTFQGETIYTYILAETLLPKTNLTALTHLHTLPSTYPFPIFHSRTKAKLADIPSHHPDTRYTVYQQNP